MKRAPDMSKLPCAVFVAIFALSACRPAEPGAVGPRAPATAAVTSPAAASASASAAAAAPPKEAAGCDAGAISACDALAERWGSRDFVRGASTDEARLAAASLKEGCEARAVSSACLAYAVMRKSGIATGKPDGEGAKPFFAKLRALGDLNGFRGEPTSAEGASALSATNAACAGGRARACGQLGWAAYTAVQRDKSVKDAFVAYARACELGSGNGCRWAGHFAATYPETGATARAEALLARGCVELDNAGACDELGVLEAKVGHASAAEARYLRACDGGSRTGCAHLGEILLARGDAKAADALGRACDAGEDAACKKLSGANK